MIKNKVFAVFGVGTFGREVGKVLSEKGAKVIAIDKDPQLIDKIKDLVTQGIILDSTDEDALKSAPLENIDVAIVAIGDNVEASILTTALLKKIGIPYIMARAISEIHMQVLKQIGAHEVINLEIEEGRRIARKLIAPDVLDTIPISKNLSLAEVYVPKDCIGKSLRDIDLRNTYRLNAISIQRISASINEEGTPVKIEQNIFPEASDVLRHDDILLVVGDNADIDLFKET